MKVFRKAILLIHGFAGGTYDFESLAKNLECINNYDVFTFTLNGHDGNSSEISVTPTSNIVDKYPFTTIIEQDKDGKKCGTQLFYDYLVRTNLIKKNKAIIYFCYFFLI